MKIVELFEQARRLAPKDQASFVGAKLPEALVGSPISVWRRGDPIPVVDRRILIGIAPYSLPDLQLVDKLTEVLKRRPGVRDSVQIFDVLSCSKMVDFEGYVPGVGSVYQTPVLGIWENGILVERATGAKARQIISRRYGLSPED